jgi:hypothetical protein
MERQCTVNLGLQMAKTEREHHFNASRNVVIMSEQNKNLTSGLTPGLAATIVAGLLWAGFSYTIEHVERPRLNRQGSVEVQVAAGTWHHRGTSRPASYRGYGFQGMGTLPTGRRTWQGRYFGNINNRYYGPQYGYF